jgi:mono/diheme cytochrome c family protein
MNLRFKIFLNLKKNLEIINLLSKVDKNKILGIEETQMKNQKITLLLTISLLSAVLLVNCGEKKPEGGDNTASANTAAAGPDSAKGKEAFELNCSSCHGLTGQGDGVAAASLNPKPRNFKAPGSEWKNGKTLEGIKKTLSEGLGAGSPMVSYAHLGDETIANIAAYILELGKE